MTEKPQLPNATAVLVLGICSIVIGCYGLGIILGIIGIALSGKGRAMYKANPEMYSGYGSLNAGFIMSIIGLSLGVLWIILMVFFGVALLGSSLGHSYNY
ncbi:MAG TPA: CCC motif membrane protein [Chitinophagaceae bacterium]|nr:CCC motif membrane protein [Chitinophagaceae bacterium]